MGISRVGIYWVGISLVEIIQDANCPAGNYPGENYLGGNCSDTYLRVFCFRSQQTICWSYTINRIRYVKYTILLFHIQQLREHAPRLITYRGK